MKSQSAMEYLMTYGWAILIIAVVLAVLFQLGVFSGGNFAPKAQAGSCEVQKTSVGSSLVGECQGQLPQYIGQFNGQNSYVQLPSSAFPSGETLCNITLTAWSYDLSVPGSWGGVVSAGACNGENCIDIIYRNDNVIRFEQQGNLPGGYDAFTTGPYQNKWAFSALTISNGISEADYVNGGVVGTSSTTIGCVTFPASTADDNIGAYAGHLNGYISNVQMYNTSLSSAEVNALYAEGIGGAPIRPQNILGWWPLNGNGNDYSGNNYNGQINGASFSSSWQSSTGYTAP